MSYDDKLSNSGGDWSFRNQRRPDNMREREDYNNNNRKRENMWNDREEFSPNPNSNFYQNNTKRRKMSDQDVEPGEITPKFKARNYDNVMESQSPVRVPFSRVTHHKKDFPDQIDRNSRLISPRDDIYHRQLSLPMNMRRDRFRDPNFRNNRGGDQYYQDNEKFNFPPEKEREMYERDNFRDDITENPNYEYDRNSNFRDRNWNNWRNDRDQRDRDNRDLPPQNIPMRGGVRKQRGNWPDARDKDFNRMRDMNRRMNIMDNRKPEPFRNFRNSMPSIPHVKEEGPPGGNSSNNTNNTPPSTPNHINNNNNNISITPNVNNNNNSLNNSNNMNNNVESSPPLMIEDTIHKKRWDANNSGNNIINTPPTPELHHQQTSRDSLIQSSPAIPKLGPVSAMKDFKNKKDRADMDESPTREEEPPPPKFKEEEELDTQEDLPTKQEIIQDMDKLDIAMGEIKVELEKFRKLKADSHKPKDRSNLSIVERILLDNQEKAFEHSKIMKDYEVAEAEKVHHLVVYRTDPIQSSIFRPRMMHFLRKKMITMKQKEKILARSYLYHKYQWELRLKSLNVDNGSDVDDCNSSTDADQSYSSSKNYDVKSPKETAYTTRRTSRSRSCKEDMQNNHDDPLSTKNDTNDYSLYYLKTLAPPVNMILDECELKKKFIDNNRKVEDSLLEYQKYKLTNPWTVEEQEIFLKRYLLHPKQFGKIANFLQNKSIEDVISFYYRNKLRLDLKNLLSRKRQRRHLSRAHRDFKEDSPNTQAGLWKEPLTTRGNRSNRARVSSDPYASPSLSGSSDEKKEKKVKDEPFIVEKKKPGKPAKVKPNVISSPSMSSPSLSSIKDSPLAKESPKLSGRKRLSNTNSNNAKKKHKKDSPHSSPSNSPSRDDVRIVSPSRSPTRSPSPSRKAKSKALQSSTPKSAKSPSSSLTTQKSKSPPPSPTHSSKLQRSSNTKVRTSTTTAPITTLNIPRMGPFSEDDAPSSWTEIERDLFKRAILSDDSYMNFKLMADVIGTKNQFECRSYYYNVFQFINPRKKSSKK